MPAQIATAEDMARLEGKIDALTRILTGATVQPAPEWVSIRDYMARHGIKSASTVYRKIEAGELQARGSGKTREVKV